VNGLRLDPDALVEWLVRHAPELRPPLTAVPVTGGRSNLTLLLSDAAGHRWVLRRPPLHGVLPSAHDVLREYRIMGALAGTAVPVPRMVGSSGEDSPLGAPFFVMSHVDGMVPRTTEAVRDAFTPAQRRAAAKAAIATLAALHDLAPEDVGLGDLGRRDAYVERQLRRWLRQWEASRTREQPLVDSLHRRLGDAVPAQAASGIVHGDFRLDNLILGPGGEVRAVLDWELSTLGDPLADLGTMLAYWTDPGEEPLEGLATVTACEGFPTRRELAAWYAGESGRAVDGLGFYVAWACWKIAVILEGVYARYAAGAMGDGPQEDTQEFIRAADRLLERADETLRRGDW
jgi:aminoglycoside phosphotransferase (APT) family kinase protein